MKAAFASVVSCVCAVAMEVDGEESFMAILTKANFEDVR